MADIMNTYKDWYKVMNSSIQAVPSIPPIITYSTVATLSAILKPSLREHRVCVVMRVNSRQHVMEIFYFKRHKKFMQYFIAEVIALLPASILVASKALDGCAFCVSQERFNSSTQWLTIEEVWE